LQGSLPKDEYYRLTRTEETKRLPFDLLRQFDNIPDDASGDVFGQIYEYFLGKFALSEGQGGGEFFTPRSVVRLVVEIIEPHGGTVFDPACGSGGMFVQSAQFIEKHREEFEGRGDDTSVFVSGQEKSSETVKLARMNLAVNGLRGQVLQGITYYDDHFQSLGKFDYVLANPPFNVDEVSLFGVEKDPRFNTYGIARNKTKAKKSEQGKETVANHRQGAQARQDQGRPAARNVRGHSRRQGGGRRVRARLGPARHRAGAAARRRRRRSVHPPRGAALHGRCVDQAGRHQDRIRGELHAALLQAAAAAHA